MYIFCLFIISYLIGSIPFGLILCKLYGLGDLRKIGSGNIGATNALRTGNKIVALLTLLGDALKGTVSVVLAKLAIEKGFVTVDPNYISYIVTLAGLAAILGHIYSCFLKLKGGKGVATYLGVLLGLSLLLFAVFLSVWILTAYVSKYSSISALVATWTCCIVAILLIQNHNLIFLLISILISYTHRSNIHRFFTGTESKINAK